MAEKPRGLHRKFNVNRVDGRDRPGEKHYGCQYFVLDMMAGHDPFALPALEAYAAACEEAHPELAHDLQRWCAMLRRPTESG